MNASSSRRAARICSLLTIQLLLLAAEPVVGGSLFGGDSVGKYAGHPAFKWHTTITDHSTIY